MNKQIVDFSERRGGMDKEKALERRLPRSSAASARARSCGWAPTTSPSTSRPSPPARSASTSRWASAACPGRIIEIYGPETSGKTTLALHVIAEAQKNGGICAFVDAEHALDPVYASKLGVNVDELLISQPDTGEQALEITDTLVRSGAVDVLVVDSVAALTPRAELEGDMGDSQVGPAGPPDEPGAAQADRRRSPSSQCHGDLHQPDPHEDRRDVRQPRDHHRRQRAEVLRLGAPRYPPHRRDQGPRRGRRQPHPREGRQEQGRAAVQAGRVRHHVRRGHLASAAN